MSEVLNVKVKVEIVQPAPPAMVDAPPTPDRVAGEVIEISPKALDAVLFDFNPSSKLNVAIVKALCAAVIEKMQRIRDDGSNPQSRMASIAITQMEICQMIAVKAYFAK